MCAYAIYMISTTVYYCACRFTQQLRHKNAYIVNIRSIISHLDINNGTYTIWQECTFNEPDWNTNQSLAIQFWGEWFDSEWHAKQWHRNGNPVVLLIYFSCLSDSGLVEGAATDLGSSMPFGIGCGALLLPTARAEEGETHGGPSLISRSVRPLLQDWQATLFEGCPDGCDADLQNHFPTVGLKLRHQFGMNLPCSLGKCKQLLEEIRTKRVCQVASRCWHPCCRLWREAGVAT